MKLAARELDQASEARATTRRVNLALQGGGSHGAFTWGVLDRLLEDERIGYDGLSGTSAGAMNAVVFADGWLKGGREGARAALNRFWHEVSRMGACSPLQTTMWDRLRGDWNIDKAPAYAMFDLVTRLFSPYQINPFNLNPLRDLLVETIDFEAIRANTDIKVYATATNVESGKVRVFETDEMTAEVLLASACLPLLFQAVEIDGEHFWDGGYMGNPAIFPLVYGCETNDVVIVQVNPLSRPGVPTSARDILNRINEISFNSTLMREMRAIATVSKFLDQGALDRNRYKDVRVHMIEAEADMSRLGASSKMNASWDFLLFLRDLGRRTASAWLERDLEAIGDRSSIDVFERFL